MPSPPLWRVPSARGGAAASSSASGGGCAGAASSWGLRVWRPRRTTTRRAGAGAGPGAAPRRSTAIGAASAMTPRCSCGSRSALLVGSLMRRAPRASYVVRAASRGRDSDARNKTMPVRSCGPHAPHRDCRHARVPRGRAMVPRPHMALVDTAGDLGGRRSRRPRAVATRRPSCATAVESPPRLSPRPARAPRTPAG